MDGSDPSLRPAEAIIGRRAELAVVGTFLAGFRRGPRALLIRGEPGIGKTTLWRRGIERARAAGMSVLLARAAEDEMPLAYGGLVDLFERAGGVAPDATADPFEIGRDVLVALRTAAASGPVLIAIDDLPWLDVSSGRALRYALRRLEREPIGLLATARSEAGAEGVAVSSGFDPSRIDVVELEALSLEQLRRVLEGTVSAISRPALRRIHEVSGGNPLYAIELARGLGSSQAMHLTGGLPLPASIRGAIARRLDTVSGDVVALLEVCSVIGPATPEELSRVLPDLDVAGCLATAEQLSLLTVDGRLVVRFSHPLVASVVYDRIGTLRRRGLHARLAEIVADADLRARHLALSTEDADAEVAALLESASLRAGERARHDLAADLARHSRRLTPADHDEASLRRALAEIAETAKAGELGRARALADELVASLPPGQARAQAIFYRAHNETDDCATAEAYLGQALIEVGDDDALRAWLLEMLSRQQALHRGDLAAGLASSDEAIALAIRLDDATIEMHARASRGEVMTLAGLDGWAELERCVALWESAGSATPWTGPRPTMAEHLLWRGDLAEARQVLAEVLAELGRYGAELDRPYYLYDLVVQSCAAGELREARGFAEQARQAARDADDDWAALILAYPSALADAWLGNAARARAAASARLDEATERGEQPAAARVLTLLGGLALSEGDAAAAAEHLREAVALIEATGYKHHAAIPAVPEAVEALARSGDLTEAAALLGRLEHEAAALGSAWVDAAVERARGHVLLAAGSPGEAATAFGAAAEVFAERGFRLDAARAALARGIALTRRGLRSLAYEELTVVHDAFRSMGAELWTERAAEELDRAAPGRAAGVLTPTERQIARLVAEGLRNREICARLVIASPTVEGHLTRIYRKLGIRSRVELTRLVADGLVGTEADEAPPVVKR